MYYIYYVELATIINIADRLRLTNNSSICTLNLIHKMCILGYGEVIYGMT